MTNRWTGYWWPKAALLVVTGTLACASERRAQPATLAALPGRWILSGESAAMVSARRAALADSELILGGDGSCSYRAPLSFTWLAERADGEPIGPLVFSEDCRWEPELAVVNRLSIAGVRGGISFSVAWRGPSGQSTGGTKSARIRERDGGLVISFYIGDPSFERFVDFVRAPMSAP